MITLFLGSEKANFWNLVPECNPVVYVYYVFGMWEIAMAAYIALFVLLVLLCTSIFGALWRFRYMCHHLLVEESICTQACGVTLLCLIELHLHLWAWRACCIAFNRFLRICVLDDRMNMTFFETQTTNIYVLDKDVPFWVRPQNDAQPWSAHWIKHVSGSW